MFTGQFVIGATANKHVFARYIRPWPHTDNKNEKKIISLIAVQ